MRSRQRRHGRNPQAIREAIRAAQSALKDVPAGHTVAVAFAHVFGPRNAQTPEGHPILIGGGPFDLNVETPQHAIARAARRWMGIEVYTPHWTVEYEADVSIDPAHPMHGRVGWKKLFHLRYEPEHATKWKQRGLTRDDVPLPWLDSWYLKQTK